MDARLENRILNALLGQPLVGNAFRGLLVEAMLAEVLEPEWRWCSADWASHDFENAEGVRLEVKQSAALQSWYVEGFRPNRGRFDIAERKVRWEGATRIEEAGRCAAIYVFAWHPVSEPAGADHRDPMQWEFYVIGAQNLPNQKTIGLPGIRRLSRAVGIANVAAAAATLLGDSAP
jgi:hypothetical protein